MGKYDDLLDAPPASAGKYADLFDEIPIPRGKYADLFDEIPIPRGKYADLFDADAEIQAVTPSVNTGDYTISSAKAAPTNAVPILQPVDGQWTPEAIAAHNAGANELNPPTPAAIAERDYNTAAEPLLRMRMGDVRYTSAELDKMQAPRIEAREATPIADAWENVKRAVFVTEQQKYDESIPITQPDGTVKYEYKPFASRLDRTGLMTPLLETKMMEPEADDSILDLTGKATFNFMAGLVNFGLSPLGVATTGLGAASSATARLAGFAPAGLGAEGTVAAETAARLATTARVVSGGFAVDMALAVPEQYKAATESPTLQGKVEGWLGVVSSLGFAALAAKHAAKQPLNPVERRVVENVVELAKRAPDAVLETVARNREADTYSRNLAQAELLRRQKERQAAIATEATAAAKAAQSVLPSGTQGPPRIAALTIEERRRAEAMAEERLDAGEVGQLGGTVNEQRAKLDSVKKTHAQIRREIADATTDAERRSLESELHNEEMKLRELAVGVPRAADPLHEGVLIDLNFAPDPAIVAAGAAPKLREGQHQGDLLSGSKNLTLVGERVKSEAPKQKGPEPTIEQTISDALDAYGDLPSAWEHLDSQVKALEGETKNKATVARLNAAKRKLENVMEDEARREEMSALETEQGKGHELLSSVKELGGLPTLGEKGRYATGELQRIAEASKGAFLRFFRKGAKSLDRLRESLNERGFAFETPEQMLMAIEDSLATNKKQYGSQFSEGYTGGPGAMGPVEKAYQDASRKIFQSAQEPIQQRRVAEQREDREEWLRRSDPDRMAEAEAIMEKNENAGRDLVNSINAGETKSATDIQELILVRELIDQHAKRDAAAERLADPDPTITRTEREQYQKDWNEANERIGLTEDASDRTGSEKGAAFRMRRMMVADDYSLRELSRRERKMKKRDLTPKEIEALRKESDSIKKTQEEMDRLVETEKKKNEESAVDSVLAAAIADREAQKSEAQRTGALPYHPSILARAEEIVKGIESKRDELRAKVDWRKLFGSQSGAVGGVGGGKGEGKPLGGKSRAQETREARAAAVEYLAYEIAAHVSRFGVNRAKTLEVMLDRFDDSIKPFYDKAWDEGEKIVGGKTKSEKPKVAKAVKTGATAPEKQPKPPKSKDTLVGEGRAAVEKGEGLHNVVAQIVDGMIEAGNRNRADIFESTTKIVQEFMPEATERDVNRAYVDYGKKTYPNPDDAAAFKRKTRQVKKIGEDIDRLKEKLRPELQGYQREKLDIELRRLIKLRSELLKDSTLPQEPGAFASRDEATQTRIKNRIEELDRYFKTGEKPVEGKPTQPASAVTEQLRAEKEALEAYVKEVDAAKNPPLSDAQKALDAAMIARERAAQILDDISTGKVKDPAKVKEALAQLEEDVRLETDALKALAAEMRRDAKPKGDPGYLKEQALIKALERAIASYADKVTKVDLAGKGKVQGPDSRRVAQLKSIRDSRRAAYQAAKDAGKPVRSPEDRYNDTRLNEMKRREEDLKARATRQAAGDFSKNPKPVTPALRRDVLNKKAQLQKMKDKINIRQKEYELSQQPAWQKALGVIGETRGVVLGSDLGVLTRQGAFSWSRPQHAIVSTIKGFQSMFSPEAMGRHEVEMRERVIDGKPVAPIRKEAGLQTTDIMSHPEELVISRLLSRMPDIKIGGKTIKISIFFKGLERFQTTFINDVRMRTFDAAVKRGFTPEELKLRANFINSATGRSNAKMVSFWMSAIFTSPRYERSRWEMLAQPFRNVGALARSGLKGELNRAAAANLQDMVVTAAGAMVLFQLAATAGGYKVNWDPESTDFLKMRKGDEVWDVTAGLAPRIRDLMRIWVGWNHPDYKENWMKTGGKMIVRTLNPALKTPVEQLSIAMQRINGEDDPKSPFTGFKSEEEREGLITLAPLIIQSMRQAYQEDGLDAAVWAGSREFIGSSVSRYPEPEE